MHAITILHRILSASFPEIHAKRLASLLAAVEAVVTGSRLTLSDLGRGLFGKTTVKHNIKRIDRLLGNSALHTELPGLYEALVQAQGHRRRVKSCINRRRVNRREAQGQVLHQHIHPETHGINFVHQE